MPASLCVKENLVRFRTFFFIATTAIGFSTAAAATQAPHEYPVRPVPFTAVGVADEFWTPRLVTSRETTIPYCFEKCEETERINNFARAGGLLDGKFEGTYFNDSDVYKIIEGAAYVLALQKNEKLDKYLDELIAKIAAAQEDDGYLYTSRTIFLSAGKDEEKYNPPGGKPRWSAPGGHELYCVGHLYEAAVAHHVATGKRNLLDVVLKNANLICDTFGPGKKENWPPGHQEIEIGLARLYRLTGEKKYLDTAKFFLDARGRADGRKFGLFGTYSQDHKPVVEQEKAVGHAVRAAYMYAGMADVAALVGDKSYVTAIDRIWHDVVETKLYVTGGIGAAGGHEGFGDPYDLPNRVAYCETCASIANVYWNHRLFCFTGDGKYIDVMERTLYNALLSGVSLEGNTFFYPNPLETEDRRARSPWFGCACCPSNISRFIPSMPGYVYAVDDAGKRPQLYVNLYVASDSTVQVGDDAIGIRQTTRYPWDGKVGIAIDTKADFTLKLRIPGWARNEAVPGGLYKFVNNDDRKATLTVNGQATRLDVKDGYATVDRAWQKGDRVELELPMPVRRVTADPRLVENLGKVALQRGPIVYCIEGVDVEAKSIPSLLIDDQQKLTSEYESDLLGGVAVVQGNALETRWAKGADGKKTLQKKPVAFRAVPYYAWAHRDADGMCIWIGRTPEGVRPEPLPTIASTSRATASHGNVAALKDQREPRSSGDHANQFLHWWPNMGKKEWVEYRFAKPAKVNAVEIYWFDDTGRGACRLPESWTLLYRDGDAWKPVANPSAYGVEIDRYNRTTFDPVATDGLRLEIQSQERWAGGIHEWKIEGEEK
ncbi:MAG: glycoside hydrolase family 127 protein [Candidatus Nealsonbacteria bacterium]|nr:glycoside hydrolase family 127 protein [Candidatus Nealsonbacteria bacterium]